MAAWPATLPPPTYDGYALNPVDPSIRTDMEMGAARSRRRTAARNDKLNVTWKFTDAEMAAFRTWFDNSAEAAGGSAWFTMDLAIGATGIESHNVRFDGMWQATALPGLNWYVSAKIEVR